MIAFHKPEKVLAEHLDHHDYASPVLVWKECERVSFSVTRGLGLKDLWEEVVSEVDDVAPAGVGLAE